MRTRFRMAGTKSEITARLLERTRELHNILENLARDGQQWLGAIRRVRSRAD